MTRHELIAIILMLGCPNLDANATEACGPMGNYSIFGATTQALTALASSDMKKFCDESVTEGVGGNNFGLSPNDSQKFLSNEDSAFDYMDTKPMKDGLSATPWSQSWLPNLKLRLASYTGCLGIWNLSLAQAKTILSLPAPVLTQNEALVIKNSINNEFSTTSADSPSGPGAKANNFDNALVRTVACGMLSLSSSLSCQKAIPRVKEIMNQKGALTLPDANITVLTNSKYQEGLRKVALKLMGKADAASPPQGDLFSDIQTSFIESGISSVDATEMTWNVLGVIGTGGSNYSNYVKFYGPEKANKTTKLALAVIAGVIPLLNQKSKITGRIYSYPPEVTSHCDNGKPYHFWMSAYLARRLIKEGVSANGASAAVFTAEKVYQFASESPGRHPEVVFTTDTFDGFNNIERMDLTYAAAGVTYGTQSALNKHGQISVDQGIQTIVKSSVIIPSISEPEAKNLLNNDMLTAFKRWNDKIAPDSVFKLYNP